MMEWKVETDKDGSIRSAEIKLEAGEFGKPGGFGKTRGFRISIHHYVRCGDAWFVTAHDIGVKANELKATGVEEAKREGLLKIYERISELVESLTGIAGEVAAVRWDLLNPDDEG